MKRGDFRIWRAEPDDAAVVAAVASRTFVSTYSDLTRDESERYCLEVLSIQAFEGVLERPDALVLLVSLQSGHCVGYAQFDPAGHPQLRRDCRPIELVRLYLDREVQGRGMGTALLRTGLQWARDHDYDDCWLRAWDQNPEAVAFYEGNGFEIFGCEAYVAGGMDDVVFLMQRSLDRTREPGGNQWEMHGR